MDETAGGMARPRTARVPGSEWAGAERGRLVVGSVSGIGDARSAMVPDGSRILPGMIDNSLPTSTPSTSSPMAVVAILHSPPITGAAPSSPGTPIA